MLLVVGHQLVRDSPSAVPRLVVGLLGHHVPQPPEEDVEVVDSVLEVGILAAVLTAVDSQTVARSCRPVPRRRRALTRVSKDLRSIIPAALVHLQDVLSIRLELIILIGGLIVVLGKT